MANYQSNVQKLHQRYSNASSSLFIISLMTVINIIMLVAGGDTYFLFSSSVPYVIVVFGMLLCGVYPSDEYLQEFGHLKLFDKSAFAIFIIIAAAIIILYIICAIFAQKRKVRWIIFALIFFCIDTILMFLYYGFTLDIIVDIFFHIYVIVTLTLSINAHYQLKKLPKEQPLIIEENKDEQNNNDSEDPLIPKNSPILRKADFSVKSRILLECSFSNHTIIYRRVKRVNELIIDGNVYDEYSAVAEFDHSLVAEVDGHKFIAGLKNSKSFIVVDGMILRQKIRWI